MPGAPYLCPDQDDEDCGEGIKVPKIDKNGDGIPWPEDGTEQSPFSDQVPSDQDPDEYEGHDTDGDGLPDSLDLDEDGDGLIDTEGLDGLLASADVSPAALLDIVLAHQGLSKVVLGGDLDLNELPTFDADLNADGKATVHELVSSVNECLQDEIAVGEKLASAYLDGGAGADAIYEQQETVNELSLVLSVLYDMTGIGEIASLFGMNTEAQLDPKQLGLSGSNLTLGGLNVSFVVADPFSATILDEQVPDEGFEGGVANSTGEGGSVASPSADGSHDLDNERTMTVGDPVMTSNGSFSHNEFDARLTGCTASFTVERLYNSRSGVDGSFGPGWSAGYLDAAITVILGSDDLPGSLLVNYGNGNTEVFRRAPNLPGLQFFPESGTYSVVAPSNLVAECDSIATPPNWINEPLVGTLPGWVLRSATGKTFWFCPPMFRGLGSRVGYSYLRRVGDEYGNTIAFRRDIAGNCVSIQDDCGKSIEFIYDGNRIVKAIDSEGLTWDYTYSSKGLAKVEAPEVSYLNEVGQLGVARPTTEYDYLSSGGEWPDYYLRDNLVEIRRDGVVTTSISYYVDESDTTAHDRVSTVTIDGATDRYRYIKVTGGEVVGDRSPDFATEHVTHDGRLTRHEHSDGLVIRTSESAEFWNSSFEVVGAPINYPLADESPLWRHFETEYDSDYRQVGSWLILSSSPSVRRNVVEYEYSHQITNPLVSAKPGVVRSLPNSTDSGELPLVELFEYDLVTSMVTRHVDVVGAVSETDYGHFELEYDDARDLYWPKLFRLLPEASFAGQIPQWYDQGDINGDGALGDTFEMVADTAKSVMYHGATPGSPPQYADVISRYEYDDGGRITKELKPNGTSTEYIYNASGALTTMRENGVNVLETTFVHDERGNVKKTTFPDERVQRSVYDWRGLLLIEAELPATSGILGPPISVSSHEVYTPPSPMSRYHFYDLRSRLRGSSVLSYGSVSLTYPSSVPAPGLAKVAQYDDRNNVIRETEYSYVGSTPHWERSTEYQFDGSSRVVEVLHADGGRVETSYDGYGAPYEVVRSDTLGVGQVSTVQSQYDELGRFIAEDGGNAKFGRTEYNGHGSPVLIKSEPNRGVEFTYDAFERAIESRAVFGSTVYNKSTLVLDSRGRKLSETVHTYNPDAFGGAVEDANSLLVRSYGYAIGHGNVLWTRQVAPNGESRDVRHVYNSDGRTIAHWYDAAGTIGEEFVYDEHNRRKTVIERRGPAIPGSPDLVSWDFMFDGHGREFVIDDGAGSRTISEFSVRGAPTRTFKPGIGRVDQIYASTGELVSKVHVSDDTQQQREASWEFDSIGRLERSVEWSGREVQLIRGPYSEVIEQRIGGDTQWTQTFDAWGRPVARTVPGHSVHEVFYDFGMRKLWEYVNGVEGLTVTLYSYDSAGQAAFIDSRTDGLPPIITGRRLDSHGNVLEEGTTVGSQLLPTTLASYNAFGELHSVEMSGGVLSEYERDSLGRVTRVVDETGALALERFDLYGQSGAYRTQFATGTEVRRSYQASGALQSVTAFDSAGTLRGGLDVAYAAFGMVDTRTWANGVEEQVGYDGFGRLASVDVDRASIGLPPISEGWDLDASDNIVEYSYTGVSTAIQPIGDKNQRLAVTPQWNQILYNNRGDEVSRSAGVDGAISREWWPTGELKERSIPASGTDAFVYDAVGRLIGCSNANGWTIFVWLGSRIVERIAPGGQSERFVRSGDGSEIWGVRHNGGLTRAIAEDHLGSPVLTENANGLFETTPFSAYGSRLESNMDLAGPGLDFEIGYLGAPHSSRVNEVCLGARWLDTQGGAFISKDPIESRGGLNWYGYANGNPLKYTDRFGLAANENVSPVDALVQLTSDVELLSEGQNIFNKTLGHTALAVGIKSQNDGELAELELTKEDGNYKLWNELSAKEQRTLLGNYVDKNEASEHPKVQYGVALARQQHWNLAPLQEKLSVGGVQLAIAATMAFDAAKTTAGELGQVPRYIGEKAAFDLGHGENAAAWGEVTQAIADVAMLAGGAGALIKAAGARLTTAKAVSAAKSGVSAVGKEPARIYSARELVRRSEAGDSFHNFPESFNKSIFGGNRQVVSSDYVLYTERGAINGVRGTFEIGVRPSVSGLTEVIRHRFFRPDR